MLTKNTTTFVIYNNASFLSQNFPVSKFSEISENYYNFLLVKTTTFEGEKLKLSWKNYSFTKTKLNLISK